jgi:natural product precursor
MKKLKLTQLAKKEIAKKEMISIRGGCGSTYGCGCGCIWEGTPGGSSSFDNHSANWDLGISTHEEAHLEMY